MRKYIQLVESLYEAPLSDIEVHGDHGGDSLDKPGGSFGDLEKKMIRKNIITGEYFKKLKGLPFDLHMVILNQSGIDKIAAHYDKHNVDFSGQVIWDEPPIILNDSGNRIKAPFLEPVRASLLAKPTNGITLIMGSNYTSGGGTIPPTPWIVVHRLLHNFGYFNLFDANKYSQGKLAELIPDYRPADPQQLSWWDVPMMKSIQNPAMDNEPELWLEMATEYLIRGDIRINTDLIKDKCDKNNLNSDQIINHIQQSLSKFKIAVMEAVESMKGKTLFI